MNLEKNSVTYLLMTHIVEQPVGLDPRVTRVAQRASSVLDEAGISQLHVTLLAAEAGGVPVRVHRFYHTGSQAD